MLFFVYFWPHFLMPHAVYEVLTFASSKFHQPMQNSQEISRQRLKNKKKRIFFHEIHCLVAFITKSSLVRFLAHYSPLSKRRKIFFAISRHPFRNKILTDNGTFLQILQPFCKILLLGISKYMCAVLIVLVMNMLKCLEMCYIPSLQP